MHKLTIENYKKVLKETYLNGNKLLFKNKKPLEVKKFQTIKPPIIDNAEKYRKYEQNKENYKTLQLCKPRATRTYYPIAQFIGETYTIIEN